jgi:hypothetical protein
VWSLSVPDYWMFLAAYWGIGFGAFERCLAFEVRLNLNVPGCWDTGGSFIGRVSINGKVLSLSRTYFKKPSPMSADNDSAMKMGFSLSVFYK